MAPESISDAPVLHVDDLTTIARGSGDEQAEVLQERARLRAASGDYVIASTPVMPGYEKYCREQLELGAAEWFAPKPVSGPLRLIDACWNDRHVRRSLVRAVRKSGLRYVHPHIGNRIRRLQRTDGCVGIKLPNASGGTGNLVIPIRQIRECSLSEIDAILRERVEPWSYESGAELLVTVWQTRVRAAPSAQFWIPTLKEGTPILEGLFDQLVEGVPGHFAGFKPAALPSQTRQQLDTRCWMLARVFQLLGYVGRCSFDAILVGEDLETARMQFVECNGRWGGTSLPMTMMNRLFGDWQQQPFACRVIKAEGLRDLSFVGLLARFRTAHPAALYDRRTGRGQYILFNPQRMVSDEKISFVALGDTWDESLKCANESFPELLRSILRRSPVRPSSTPPSASP